MGLELQIFFTCLIVYIALGIKKSMMEIKENNIRHNLFIGNLNAMSKKTFEEIYGFPEDVFEEDSPLHIDTMTGLNPSTPFWVFDEI